MVVAAAMKPLLPLPPALLPADVSFDIAAAGVSASPYLSSRSTHAPHVASCIIVRKTADASLFAISTMLTKNLLQDDAVEPVTHWHAPPSPPNHPAPPNLHLRFNVGRSKDRALYSPSPSCINRLLVLILLMW